MPAVRAWIIVLALTQAPSSEVAFGLTDQLPSGVPDVAMIAGWERVQGEVAVEGLQVAYRFYVDPDRPALYRITQYRVTRRPGGVVGAVPEADSEKVLWNAEPGRRVPLVCYERVLERSWRTLWLEPRWLWRRLEPDSNRYRSEMLLAVRIYDLHRQRLGRQTY